MIIVISLSQPSSVINMMVNIFLSTTKQKLKIANNTDKLSTCMAAF